MSPNLATRLYSCLSALLCVILLWTRPIKRISASSSLHPSLQSSSEASELEKSSRGEGGGSANHGGVMLVGAIVILPDQRRDRYQQLHSKDGR